VIAAILRSEPTGIVQNLLADGLRYERQPLFVRADFQGTNLRGAYLGRGDVPVNVVGADFFRTDLSHASLKGCVANRAVSSGRVLAGDR
jgi:uncharacterized protein YjbI with pentapeptide repeats